MVRMAVRFLLSAWVLTCVAGVGACSDDDTSGVADVTQAASLQSDDAASDGDSPAPLPDECALAELGSS